MALAGRDCDGPTVRPVSEAARDVNGVNVLVMPQSYITRFYE